MTHRLIALGGFCLSMCLPALTQAQDQDQGQETPKQRMHVLNEQGFELFSKGEFERAARSFSRAYDLYPDINLRKNESLAWFKHGDCERARIAGRLFLDAPNISKQDKRDAQTVVVRCTLTLAQQAADAREIYKAQLYLDEADGMSMSTEDQVTYKKISDEVAIQRAASEKAQAPTAPSSASGSPLAWGLVGAGGVLLTSAVIYHVFVSSDGEELIDISQNGGDKARYDTLASRLDTASVLLPTLYATGVLSLGAGGALLVFPSLQESSAQSSSSQDATRSFGLKVHATF